MSDWAPPERALDNLPSEIALPEPVTLEPGVGRVHRLFEIRPIGAGAARLGVQVDLEAAADEAGLRLDPERPLLGFHPRRRVETLEPEILLERQMSDETALLALDLSAITAFDPSRLTAGEAASAALIVPFVLSQSDRLRANPIRRRHRLRLEIARADWLRDNYRIAIEFGEDPSRRAVDYPKARIDEGPERDRPHRLAQIVVSRSEGAAAPSRTAKPLTATLEARLTPEAKATDADQVAGRLNLDRAEIRIDPPELRLEASGGRGVSRHDVWVRCGPGGLREPEATTPLTLHVRLDRGEAFAKPDRFDRRPVSFRLIPDLTSAALTAAIDDLAADETAEAPVFGVDGQSQETRTLAPQLLRAVNAGVAPSIDLIAVDLVLSGRAANAQGRPDEARISASARVLDAERRPIDEVPVELRIDPEPARATSARDSSVVAALTGAIRRARFVAAIEQSERAFEQALDALYEPGQAFQLELDLKIAGLVGGALRAVRPFRFEAVSDRRVLAIDLGGAAIAAALSDEAGEPKLLPLGRAMARVDPQTAEGDGYFIDSALGLGADECWRPRLAPETLWRAVPGAALAVDAEDAALGLERNYLLASPPLSGAAQGRARPQGPRLSLGAVKLAAEGGALPLDRAVWTADSAPDLARAVDPEKVVADALHELVDHHMAAIGATADAYCASVAMTAPTRAGPRQRARLRRAALPMLRRLGHDPDKAANAITLVSEAEAALAHHLNRLPADGRGKVSAALFDLGAATLDMAIATADRIDPQNGARVRGAEISAQVGVEIGGDAIDLVLYFTIADALRRLSEAPDAPARLVVDPLEPIADMRPARVAGDPASTPEARLAAKEALIRAIRRAKVDLSERCRAASPSGEYGWPSNELFRVQVGLGADAAAPARRAPSTPRADWPVQEIRPGAVAAAGPVRLAGGVTLEADADGRSEGAGPGALRLSFTRAAIERPAMRELMRFLTEDALGHLFNRRSRRRTGRSGDFSAAVAPIEPVDYLIVSGRAALWPLVYEGLSAALDATGGLASERAVARAFAHPEPESDAALKSAAVRGAAVAAAEQTARAARRDHDQEESDLRHFALLVSERDLEGRERFTQLIPRSRFDQMRGYSGFMRLVSAPPRLTIDELNASPWARALIAPTGVAADSRSLGLGPDSPPPELKQGRDGDYTLRIGDVAFTVDGGRFERAPSLHRGVIDVTESIAPPGYPDSVRCDPPDAAALETGSSGAVASARPTEAGDPEPVRPRLRISRKRPA